MRNIKGIKINKNIWKIIKGYLIYVKGNIFEKYINFVFNDTKKN